MATPRAFRTGAGRRWMLAPVLVTAVALVIVATQGLSDWRAGDWGSEVRGAVDALRAGHLARFLGLAPAYGGSLILRAPFLLIPNLWHGGEQAAFDAAALPAMLASAILGVWLFGALRRRGRAPVGAWLALLLIVANPVTISALQIGHAEELLAGVLAVAAVLAAERDSPVSTGVLLALAIASKDWALLAVGPVLLALPGRRTLALGVAALTGAVVLAPLLLGSGGAFGAATSGAVRAPAIFSPFQWWWFLGHIEAGRLGHRAPIGWVSAIAHPLIIAVSVPLTGACWALRSRPRRPPQSALLLLALLLLLRCALDPWDNGYYPLPFLLALTAWDALSFDRPPILALGGALIVALLTRYLPGAPWHLSLDALALCFLAATIPAFVAMAGALYGPWLPRRSHAVSERLPIARTA